MLERELCPITKSYRCLMKTGTQSEGNWPCEDPGKKGVEVPIVG